MSSKQFKWALAVLAISGLAGGVLSNWLLPKGAIAYAQEANTAQVVIAQEFRLVDEAGEPRAWLFLSDDGQPSLMVYEKTGKQRGGIGLLEDGQPGMRLYDAAGQPLGVL